MHTCVHTCGLSILIRIVRLEDNRFSHKNNLVYIYSFIPNRHITMSRTFLSIAAVASAFAVTANAGAVDLTPDNFDSEVTSSGKGAFVKFLAPW